MTGFEPRAETRAFWAACREGKLMVQRCGACGHLQLYPRAACARCMSERVSLVAASGRGKVHTFAIVHRAPSAEFAADVPYLLALVDLAEGPRLMTRLVDIPPDEVHIGMPLSVRFVTVSDTVALPVFAPENEL